MTGSNTYGVTEHFHTGRDFSRTPYSVFPVETLGNRSLRQLDLIGDLVFSLIGGPIHVLERSRTDHFSTTLGSS